MDDLAPELRAALTELEEAVKRKLAARLNATRKSARADRTTAPKASQRKQPQAEQGKQKSLWRRVLSWLVRLV